MEYQHGGDIYSHKIEWDFSANISPLGMPEHVKDAIIQAASACDIYPDSKCRALRQAISRLHGVDMETVICGNGAADLIFQAVQALRPKKALVLAPTFSEYEQALTSISCQVEYFYLKEADGFSLCADELIKNLNPSFDLLFLCNPNNPTGRLTDKDELLEISGCCKKYGILLFIDECFLDFTEEGEPSSLIPMTAENSHVFVLKAFTKMYGMAGVRLGYGITGDKGLLEGMERVRQPWSVSTPAQAAGLAALKDDGTAKKVRHLLETERPFLMTELERIGFRVVSSSANYLLFSDFENSGEGELFTFCLNKGLLIRWCGNYHGLSGRHYRVCVKERKENLTLLRILKEVIKERNELWQSLL